MPFDELDKEVARIQQGARLKPLKFKWLRKVWTGQTYGCLLYHKWDDPEGATRICQDCGQVQVISHL